MFGRHANDSDPPSGRWRGRNRQTRDGDRQSDRSSSHQGLDKSRPFARVRFQVLTQAENARWPRQWETNADPHAAGRFTRSVATHSTFGAATVRATAMPIADSRISSASTRSSIERANTIPPTHSVAIARARDRAACPLRRNACSKTSIMTLSTVSNACRTRCSSRGKSRSEKRSGGRFRRYPRNARAKDSRGRTEPRCQQHADRC